MRSTEITSLIHANFQINPQHTIPTLVDGDFILWESRAIMIYLAEAYGKDDSLYSKDPKERGVINQRLFFDLVTLYESLGNYYYPILEKKEPDAEKFKEAEKAVDLFNTLLEDKEYAAGDHLTLADLSMIASVTTFEPAGFDFGKYLNVAKWIKRCKENIVGYQVNQDGIDKMMAVLGVGEQAE
jgi:glutathione S-transferase